MHKTSFENMRLFVENYLQDKHGKELKIVDLGSTDVNGSYKELFDDPKWAYTGVDIEAGKNVDIVIKDIYDWKEIESDSVDVMVSGQTFEHIEYIWKTIEEIKRILKSGGIGCLIAPSSGPEHKYPVDCWRILPDGFRALAKYVDLEVVDVQMTTDEFTAKLGEENIWHDVVFIFRKK